MPFSSSPLPRGERQGEGRRIKARRLVERQRFEDAPELG
jgi:hypothetical protein